MQERTQLKMTKESFIKMTKPFRDNPKRAWSLHIFNKIITGSIFLGYPLILGYLLLKGDCRILGGILVPMFSFIAVSLFRHVVNRPRPYEKFNVTSIIEKDTEGKSFPSRHVFSAFVIATTALILLPCEIIGIIMLIAATVLGIIRVVSGVHFISDVLAGAVVGILSGLILLLF